MIESRLYEKRRLRLLARLATGSRVLDLGNAQQPNPYLRGFHRVGLDMNEPDPAGDCRYEEQLTGDVSDVSALLHGRKFDTIICGELIEHLENPFALLRDLRGLLTESGRLLVSTPNPLAFPVVIAEFFRLKSVFYTPDHLYYFLPRWVERLFDATGYELIALRPVGLWTPLFAIPLVPVAMSYQVIYVGRKRS